MNELIHRAFTLLREVKSVSVATLNDGIPDVRIADVMLAEDDGLYFITARGKPYYRQLKASNRIAICAMDKNYVTVRISGIIQFCGDEKAIKRIFESNPILETLYPGDTKDILEAFHLYQGKGEIFDLSTEPPGRERFAFGGESVNPPGYNINNTCTACGICIDACPVGVISDGDIYSIDESHCLECGRCAQVCPENAIDIASGM